MPTDSAILRDAPEVTITADQARDASADELLTLIGDKLDEAQAPVFGDEQPYNYLIIKIVK
jgi:hypothetical protein